MTVKLEHANLCVHDIDAVVRSLKTAFPDFRIRHDRTEPDGSRWVHVGNNETYIALNQANPDEAPRGTPYKGRPGLHPGKRGGMKNSNALDLKPWYYIRVPGMVQPDENIEPWRGAVEPVKDSHF